jgi:hypothetical protein
VIVNGEIRRDPHADEIVPVAGPRDEAAPAGGGLIRRIAPSKGSALSGFVGIAEMVFAPQSAQARREVQEQRHSSRANPSPTDPPDEDPAADESRVAACGRRGTPFSGVIVLSPRPCDPPPGDEEFPPPLGMG